jgi:hypothetical protein
MTSGDRVTVALQGDDGKPGPALIIPVRWGQIFSFYLGRERWKVKI